jgi:predicted dinucleotide-binding enzyme
MQIGIVGAGRIGGTLATLFTRGGHQVALANSRDPGTLADTVAALGPNAHAATAADECSPTAGGRSRAHPCTAPRSSPTRPSR